jgi:hypothetical protein
MVRVAGNKLHFTILSLATSTEKYSIIVYQYRKTKGNELTSAFLLAPSLCLTPVLTKCLFLLPKERKND